MFVKKCVLSICVICGMLACMLLPASAYLDDDQSYIRVGFNGACAVGVIAGTTAGELELSLENSGLAYVAIRHSNGTTAAQSDKVYTGMTARVNKTYYIKIAVYGDVDGDGNVTVSDVTAMSSLYGNVNNNEFACAADMDFNGTVSISDKYYLRDYISSYTCKAAFVSTHYWDSSSVGLSGNDQYISMVLPAIEAGQSPYPVASQHYDDRTPSELLELMTGNEVLAVGAHGSKTGIIIGRDLTLSDNNQSNLTDPEKGFSISTINTLTDNALRNCRFIHYGSCNTGEGGETADNLVNATYAKGAKAVLGYTTDVYGNTVIEWDSSFYEAIYTYGASIEEAMSLADATVQGMRGSSAVTKKRLFRGDNTQRLAHFKGISNFETTCSDMISIYGTASAGSPSVIINNGFSDSGRTALVSDDNTQGYVNISALKSGSAPLSSEAMRAAAVQAASEYINPADYILREQYIDSTGIMHYEFIKQIDGIDTSDYCGVMVTNDGSIFSVKAMNTGAFDQISLSAPSVEEISNYLAQTIGRSDFDISELTYTYTETGELALSILYGLDGLGLDIAHMPVNLIR